MCRERKEGTGKGARRQTQSRGGPPKKLEKKQSRKEKVTTKLAQISRVKRAFLRKREIANGIKSL